MAESPAPLLEARGLHAHYGASHVLHGVDFCIGAGETVALLGRNGMGKTTLIRTLFGLVRASAGSVRLRGQEVTHLATHRIAQLGVGYVPEGRGIFPNLSVKENLLMAARVGSAGQQTWTLERVLESFPRLAERLKHGGAQLSGGEQQMLAIGRALMTNPDLLILDEATEGLAPQVAHEIWQIVRRIKATGMATLIVDRNHEALRSLADRCTVLLKGTVVFDAASAQLDDEVVRQYLGV